MSHGHDHHHRQDQDDHDHYRHDRHRHDHDPHDEHATSAVSAGSAGDQGRAAVGRAVVITASTRASRGVYEDRSGPIVVQRLRSWGFDVGDAVVAPDGEPTAEAMRTALAGSPALLLTTGGTGLRADDRTPELTRPMLDIEVPGIAEAIRAAGVAKGVPTAMLSRGLCGVARGTLVVNLPGSTGGVKDALDVLDDVVHHAVDQIAGGDH